MNPLVLHFQYSSTPISKTNNIDQNMATKITVHIFAHPFCFQPNTGDPEKDNLNQV